MRAVLFCVLGLCHGGTILEYKDLEKGHAHVQSGEPGVQVTGVYSFNAPEGVQYEVQYSAGKQGFLPSADHLPVVPQDTEDVAAARASFLDAYRAAEAIKEEDELLGLEEALEEVEQSYRRRRSPVTSGYALDSYEQISNQAVQFSYQPTQFSYQPTHLSYQPKQLSYQPTQLSYQPTQLSYQPTQLSYQPFYPRYAPVYPFYPGVYPTSVVKQVSSGPSADEINQTVPSSQVVYQPYPVLRVGFQGLQPVQILPGQPADQQTDEAAAQPVGPPRVVQDTEEAAALAL